MSQTKTYLLASQSPRRRELFKRISSDFDTVSIDLDEHQIVENILQEAEADEDFILTARKVVLALAKAKARHAPQTHPFLVTADTIVVLDNKILEKPRDAREATEMLTSLCGQVHSVLTGVCVVKGEECRTFVEETHVHCYPLDSITEDIIKTYVKSGSPLDKAGGYGIQDQGGLLVEKIYGDVHNVIGLPVSKLLRVLKDME